MSQISDPSEPVPPVSPNPLGPYAPTEDRVGLAAASMMAGASASVVWFSALTSVASGMRRNATATIIAQVDPNSALVNIMVYGMVLGIVFTFVVAWWLMAPIDSRYRRGGLSMVSALGGSTLAGGLTYIVDGIGGQGALLGLCAVAAIVTSRLVRRALRAA